MRTPRVGRLTFLMRPQIKNDIKRDRELDRVGALSEKRFLPLTTFGVIDITLCAVRTAECSTPPAASIHGSSPNRNNADASRCSVCPAVPFCVRATSQCCGALWPTLHDGLADRPALHTLPIFAAFPDRLIRYVPPTPFLCTRANLMHGPLPPLGTSPPWVQSLLSLECACSSTPCYGRP